jgi:preprotein translocase subunit SecE
MAVVVDKVRETRDFVEECVSELQKVTWPDYEQLKNATLVVIVFAVLIAGVIWVMDFVVRQILQVIMSIFGA